mgnify:CR=1 FL=1
MRLRSLLASAALAATMGIGSIAMMAGPASAAVVNQPVQCKFKQQCNPKCNDFRGDFRNDCGTCYPVVTTPRELNRLWVENTTGETVTVTIGGKYYWVELNGYPRDYPQGDVITVLPGESISVAWYKHTGDHWWTWTGQERCITPPRPVTCITTGHDWNTRQDATTTDSNRPCDPPQPCTEGIHLSTDFQGNGGDCLPCFPPVTTRVTLPCPVTSDPVPCKTPVLPCKNGGKGDQRSLLS